MAKTITSDQSNIRPRITASDTQFRSLFDFEIPPSVYDFLKQEYGSAMGILDSMRMFGAINRIKLKNDVMNAFEQTAIEQPIEIRAEVSATGTSTFNFKLADTDYDDNENTFIQKNQKIYIPGSYVTDSDGTVKTTADAIITDEGTVGDAASVREFTAKFMDSNVTLTTAIPAGAKLMVGGTVYARGTGQPSGLNRGSRIRNFRTSLMKSSQEIEGGQQAIDTYLTDPSMYWEISSEEAFDGRPGIWYKNLAEQEFRFEAEKDKQILLGEENDNSLTQTSADFLGSKSNAILSGKGIIPHMDERAQKQYYAEDYGMADFDAVKPIIESQGLMTDKMIFSVGSGLNTSLENSGLEWMKDFSGAHNLLSTAPDGSPRYGELGTEFDSFKKNGITFLKRVMPSWSNPKTYGVRDDDGNYSYDFYNMGFMIPVGNSIKATFDGVMDAPPRVDNLELAFIDNNGEQRTNIIGNVFGMNGMGQPITHQYDGGARYMMSEFMTIFMGVNQSILIRKQR